MKISLALIVKADAQESLLLDRALENAAKWVDEVCVTITGENKECEAVCKKHNAKISHFNWVDNFSEARNYNFSQCTGDWVMWMDADDTYTGLEKLREVIDGAEKLGIGGVFLNYEYSRDELGNVTEKHWKMMIAKNDGTFEWKGAIHEDLLAKKQVKLGQEYSIVRVHNSNDSRGIESSERNLRILLKELESQGESPDPRTLFYTGKALICVGNSEDGRILLRDYLERSGWDDERYSAHMIIGESYVKEKDYANALKIYNDAILEKEEYPDAYLMKGAVYSMQGEWKKAIGCYEIGLAKPVPTGNVSMNPLTYGYTSLMSLAWCYLQIGQLEDATSAIRAAKNSNPKAKEADDLALMINEIKNKRDIGRLFSRIADYLKEKKQEDKILNLLSGVPSEISDSPYVTQLLNRFAPPRVWADDEICIYCPRSVEFWAPPSLDKGGIGGSETAVVWLAKELTKLGNTVTVYNYCGNMAGKYDGVTYKNFWEWNHNDVFNILISWRYPELFDLKIDAALKCLDLHDVMSPHDFPKERQERIDKIFVKTKYHRTLFPNVPDEKFVVISNGIDLDRFTKNIERQEGRCIYSSSANRGLDIILKNWPKIRAEVPKAELHVYYGWKTFYELEKHNPERVKWMRKVQEDMKQPGIIDHGRVGQAELAEEMMKSDIWLYPTYFEEINCITALENQAAGCVPVVTNYAALVETVADSAYKVRGDIHNPKVQEQWVTQAIQALKENKEQLRKELKGFAKSYSWSEIAKQWNNELTK